MPHEHEQASLRNSVHMTEVVAELVRSHTDRWWQAERNFPEIGPKFTLREKFARESRLNHFLNTLISDLEYPPRLQSERQAMQERLTVAARIFARSTLDLEDHQLDVIQNHGFIDATVAFSRMARQFDLKISGDEIYQASRNAWTMNLLQLLLGMKVEVTPAIFAYSMLYPYSDNYLDNPELSAKSKLILNERFARRLEGEDIQPQDSHEETIYHLVGMIEAQYDRPLYPQVYDSLLAIHRAQEKSLSLLRPQAAPYEVDVLSISFEKGGTAVLADGYLVAGHLNAVQRDFMFGYGVFTQLMDDLEDVKQDLQDGQLTIFSQAVPDSRLDILTNITFHLGMELIKGLDTFDIPERDSLKGLIQRGINLLLIDSAGQVSRYYSRPYLKELEAYLPFRFSHLNQTRKKLKRRNLKLSSLLEIFI
jgi:hypothetical protein